MKRMISLLVAMTLAFSLLLTGCGKGDEKIADAPERIAEESAQEAPLESESEDAVNDVIDLGEGDVSDDEVISDEVEEESVPLLIPVSTRRMYDNEWCEDDPFVQYAGGICDRVMLDHYISGFYPELEAAIEEYTKAGYEDYQKTYTKYLGYAKEDYSDDPDNFYGPYFAHYMYSVPRSDGKITCITRHADLYSGGSHPDTVYRTTVFDSLSGKVLRLSDVCADYDGMRDIVSQTLDDKYGDYVSYFGKDETLAKYFDGNHDVATEEEGAADFTLGYYGITFTFSPYEIASFADGVLNVTIPYIGNEDLFTKDFSSSSEAFAIPFEANTNFEASFEDDAVFDSIYVAGSEDYESGMMTRLDIYVNDDMYTDEDIFASKIEPVYIHTDDGRNYLYADVAEGDYHNLMVFEISRDGIEYVGTDKLGFGGYVDENDELCGTFVTDPYCFALETKLDTLGTTSGTKDYYVGDDGMPVSDDEEYDMYWPLYLTLKQNLEVTRVDDDTLEEIDNVTCREGEMIVMFLTNGEDHVIGVDERGDLVKVEYGGDDYSPTINGTDANEIFDGIMFAG